MRKGFTLPAFALGTGGLAGNPQDLSIPTDIETQARVIREALREYRRRHMRPWIDTALHYGAGNALKAVGLALGEHPNKDITLSVKVGRILVPPTADHPYQPDCFRDEGRFNRVFDYSESGVLKALEQSFEFLNQERVLRGWKKLTPKDLNTIVFVHDPERGVHGNKAQSVIAQVRNEALPALAKLKQKGDIKAIGVGTNEVSCALALADHPDLDLIMVAGRLTLLSNEAPSAPAQIRRDTEGLNTLLALAHKHKKHVIAAAPGNSGILYEGCKWYNYAPASDEIVSYKDRIHEVFRKHCTPLEAGALQFPLMAGADAVICGACNAPQFSDSLAHFNSVVPPPLWKELETHGMLGIAYDPKRAHRSPASAV